MSVVFNFDLLTYPRWLLETTDFMSVVLQFRPTNSPAPDLGDHRLHVGGVSIST